MRRTPAEPGRASAVVFAATAGEIMDACEELRFSTDAEPGITRRRSGTGFCYFHPDGRRITDEALLQRIRSLAVPPAYQRVWICSDAKGHLQATGIDARGRKQYRYHPRWRSVRDAHKFERMLAFGRSLPRIHRRLAYDLKRPGMPREKVLATVVKLLEKTLIRIGNREYARANGSYGLTTLRNHHVNVRGGSVRFSFRGKHGIRHEVKVEDPRMARIVRRCLELPGQELFTYIDEQGVARDVGSTDVNGYLREVAGEAFTAKDFRTWYATSAALETLSGVEFRTAREARAKLKEALADIARKLANTPTMCRKCYINPVVIDAFLAGELRQRRVGRSSNERARLLHFLGRLPAGAGFAHAFRAGARTRAGKRLRTARRVH
jgi:DNA topoisomerase I